MSRPRQYKTDAERVAAHRARNNLRTLSVDIDSHCVDQLEAWMKFKDMTKREVIEKLIRTQLLRKR
jgi:hypothetical protein